MSNKSETKHELVYESIREQILYCGLKPGKPVTLRGLATQLDVGVTPVREAVRRLTAEHALEISESRRVSIPAMTEERWLELHQLHALLEPELAKKACKSLSKKQIDKLELIDNTMDEAIENGDVEAYMRCNYAFHFGIYRHAPGSVMRTMVDNLWLQFGPFTRQLYAKFGTANLVDEHKQALAAMCCSDIDALYNAIKSDLFQGMSLLSL